MPATGDARRSWFTWPQAQQAQGQEVRQDDAHAGTGLREGGTHVNPTRSEPTHAQNSDLLPPLLTPLSLSLVLKLSFPPL